VVAERTGLTRDLPRAITGAKDGLNREAAYDNDPRDPRPAIGSGPGISRHATAEEGVNAA
jgi:hypothetical protein